MQKQIFYAIARFIIAFVSKNGILYMDFCGIAICVIPFDTHYFGDMNALKRCLPLKKYIIEGVVAGAVKG